MEIARERFLDESRAYHLTIGVRSRTTEAHSLLSALTAEEREQVSNAIVQALNEIEKIVRPHLGADTPGRHGRQSWYISRPCSGLRRTPACSESLVCLSR